MDPILQLWRRLIKSLIRRLIKSNMAKSWKERQGEDLLQILSKTMFFNWSQINENDNKNSWYFYSLIPFHIMLHFRISNCLCICGGQQKYSRKNEVPHL